MLNYFLNSINTGLWPYVIKILVVVLPIAMPFVLIYGIWVLRLRYLQMKFIESKKPCLLEIRLPKEIVKSPAGMEIFFSYLNAGGAGSYGAAFIEGETRPWFSCEIVSIGGEVRFFIWMNDGAKNRILIENQLYAEYPNIEIYEVKPEDDYVNNFHFNKEAVNLHGAQFTLTQPDPYPIKTYIDYGLNDNQKEEYKIDPLTHVIEFLGSMKDGENAWIQIMFRKHEKEGWKHGVWKSEKDLKKETEAAIEDVRKKALPKDAPEGSFKFPNPTKGQTEIITALERSATKTPFDAMIRIIYIAKKEVFNPAHIGGVMNCLKQYGSLNLNGFKPSFKTGLTDGQKDMQLIFPFLKKGFEEKVNMYKKNILHAYKLRSFFEQPYKNYGSNERFHRNKPFVLTTEELATIYHFPGNIVSQTPTLRRVPSKKSEAPSNIPV